MTKIDVLDKGYVRVRDKMGSDLKPADVARVSFDRRAEEFSDEQNERLVNYLFRNKEYSCIRHNVISLEIHMPLMVARQLYKYSIASAHRDDQYGWNESSRRYITEEPEFYIPQHNEWRTAPENKKQGSGKPLPSNHGAAFTKALMNHIESSMELYNLAIEQGVAVEEARLFLPSYAMYVRCYWTASLNSIFHFLDERLDYGAQKEIQDYAKAVEEIVKSEFPVIYKAWVNNR